MDSTTRDLSGASISEVEETVYVAFLLVIIIIFLFLRDWRVTLIPCVVIPVSLIGSFFVMYLAGFSINVLSMLAIVLAVGLVVDDAIVMTENNLHPDRAGNDSEGGRNRRCEGDLLCRDFDLDYFGRGVLPDCLHAGNHWASVPRVQYRDFGCRDHLDDRRTDVHVRCLLRKS